MEDKFLQVAKQVAKEAGLLIRQKVAKKVKIQFKNHDVSNIVTEVDLLSEKHIIQTINKIFPSHNIISEESTPEGDESEYTWVIDPLDGTVSFAHSMPHFSVSIGLLKNNKPIVGVIYNVMTKKLYWAEKDSGAYVNGKRIHVSKIDKLNQAAVVLGFGSIKTREEKIERYFKPLIVKVGHPYSLGSAATSYTFVANGFADATTDGGWIWDFAAGALIVEEAGGRVTDFEGKNPDWTKKRFNLLSSNGLIHDEVLEILKK